MSSIIPLLIAGTALCFVLGFVGWAVMLIAALLQETWRAIRKLLQLVARRWQA